MPVCADFQDAWVIGVSYLSLLWDQHNLPTLHYVSGMMRVRDFPVEQPAQCWQLGWQKKMYFSASHFWDSSNSFINFWYVSWGVTGLGSFVSLTAEIMGLSLSFPGGFSRDFRKDLSPRLQCKAHFSHLVLSWLIQELLHEQSPA